MQSEISKNLIITGSNRGLGYALTKMLCQKALPHNIIMTARDISKGQEKLLKLQEKYPNAKLFFHQLDVSSIESIKIFSKWYTETHKTIDILVNNAGYGISSDIYATQIATYEVAKNCLDSNFYGVVTNTESLLPLLSTNGKIVNHTLAQNL